MGSTIPKIKTNIDISPETAPILNAYLKSEYKDYDAYSNFRLEYGVINYTITNEPIDQDFKTSIKPFMNPIIHGAYGPSHSHYSNIAAVQGRLTKLHKETTLSQAHINIIMRIIEHLVPEPHVLHLSSVETIYEHQKRLTQRNILDAAIDLGPSKPFSSCFVKKEAYGNVKDPRIISQLKPQHKLEWSQILYSVSDWIKQFPWYAFGKTPKTISDKVAMIGLNSISINCTDFSRMDGRKTILMRFFNNALLLRLFQKKDAKMINRLSADDINTRASMNFKDWEYFFHTLYAWASGHPLTSIMNSLDNYVVTFTGYINSITKGGKLPKTDQVYDLAFERCNKLAILGGDDGAFGNLEPRSIENAAKWWGHKLTSDIFMKGETGVNFLSRFYGPYVFQGDPNNMCDFQRQLSKLHTTVDLKMYTPLDKLSQKLTSLKFTDSNTPLISNLIDKYLSLGGPIAARTERRFQSYWSKYDKSDQFPNVLDEWMLENIPPEFHVISFLDQLERATKLEDLLNLKPCMAIQPVTEVRALVELNGDHFLVGELKPKHIDSTKIVLDNILKDGKVMRNPKARKMQEALKLKKEQEALKKKNGRRKTTQKKDQKPRARTTRNKVPNKPKTSTPASAIKRSKDQTKPKARDDKRKQPISKSKSQTSRSKSKPPAGQAKVKQPIATLRSLKSKGKEKATKPSATIRSLKSNASSPANSPDMERGKNK